jgi:uncharacterized protein (DUF58 family)
MIIPERRLFLALGILAGIALLASVFPALNTLWYLVGIVLILAGMVDALNIFKAHGLEIKRKLPGSLALGTNQMVHLAVSNTGKHPQHIEVFDHYPSQVKAEGLPIKLGIAPNEQITVEYQLRAIERGKLYFPCVQLNLYSPWRLWKRNAYLPVESYIHSYPDFAAVSHYALLATDNKLSQMGIIKKRRRGEGQDFHQLREYRIGDTLRQIDWKATSRMKKVISREYQDERDQEIIFLLDCGHRMLTKDDELSHFDHTLNALLLLSYVALKQGDAVGLGTFAGDESRWLPPKKGLHHLQTVLNTIYDLQPGTASPDYSQAASDLLVKHKKRALVILISNVRDEDADDLLPALKVLKKRHLVLLASMRETILDTATEDPVKTFDDAVQYASLKHYLQYRKQAFDALQEANVLSIDVQPTELSVELINQYLSIKGGGLL